MFILRVIIYIGKIIRGKKNVLHAVNVSFPAFFLLKLTFCERDKQWVLLNILSGSLRLPFFDLWLFFLLMVGISVVSLPCFIAKMILFVIKLMKFYWNDVSCNTLSLFTYFKKFVGLFWELDIFRLLEIF